MSIVLCIVLFFAIEADRKREQKQDRRGTPRHLKFKGVQRNKFLFSIEKKSWHTYCHYLSVNTEYKINLYCKSEGGISNGAVEGI